MEIKNFEKFTRKSEKLSNNETFWDKKAETFNNSFKNIDENYDEFLFDTLGKKNVLKNITNVLDVGCGIGRHSYHFSNNVKNYLGIDSSQAMINYAQINRDRYKLNNCNFKKLDYRDVEEKFDLVFSAMCPSIETVSDVKKLISLSNRYILIKRILKDQDNILQALGMKQHIAHNNPEYAYGIINIFWNLSYIPEVILKKEISEDNYSLEETLSLYKKQLNSLSNDDRKKRIKHLEEIFDSEGKIRSVRKKELAIILVDKKFTNSNMKLDI